MDETLVRVDDGGTTVVIADAAYVRDLVEDAEAEANASAASASASAGSAAASATSATSSANSATASAASAVAADASADAAAASAANADSSADTAASAVTGAVATAIAAMDASEQAVLDALDGIVSGVLPTITATRILLAGVDTSAGAAILLEAGREGLFVWEGANHSANVTLDTQQAIYVAPSSDTTGASGAWVRRFSGPLDARWFGVLFDDFDGTGGTNNATAWAAMFAFVTARAEDHITNIQEIRIPGECYVGNTTIDLTVPIKLVGLGGVVGPTGASTIASAIRRAAGGSHFRVQNHNTTGDSGTVAGGTYIGGGHSVFEGIMFRGGFTTTEGEFHGIYARVPIKVRNCEFANIQGDGIRIYAGTDSNPVLGNANEWLVENVVGHNCRNTLYIAGTDANAGTSREVRGNSNRQAVIVEESFIGNAHYNAKVSNPCGMAPGVNDGVTVPASVVHYSGHRYTPRLGQETGASTNAPSGTTADNTWWLYMNDLGATSGVPTWVSGITVRAGGSFIASGSGGNNHSEWYSCYNEDGSGLPQIMSPNTVIGGTLVDALPTAATAGRISTDGGYIGIPNLSATSLFIGGSETTFGTSGSAFTFSQYYNAATQTEIFFRSFSGGFQRDGSLVSNRASGMSLYGGVGLKLGTGNAFDGGTDVLTLSPSVATFSKPARLPSFTVAGVPSAATLGAGAIIYVSNEAGGAVPAFSDGTNWRRYTDRAVIS